MRTVRSAARLRLAATFHWLPPLEDIHANPKKRPGGYRAGRGLTFPSLVLAHGFIGDRFFPPTLATDDPFAVDELSLPSVTAFDDPQPMAFPPPAKWTGIRIRQGNFPPLRPGDFGRLHFSIGGGNPRPMAGITSRFPPSTNFGTTIRTNDPLRRPAYRHRWQRKPNRRRLFLDVHSDVLFRKRFRRSTRDGQFPAPLAITGTWGKVFPPAATIPTNSNGPSLSNTACHICSRR